jgi:hypothetical protein
MADKRKWGFKKFATAGLLLALIGGITAVAVQPQLWPTSVNSFYPSFTSSISGGGLGALRTAGEVPAAAYPAERGFLGNVEEQNETGAARPKMAGIAESLSHPKTTLEAQLKSGQKFIKVSQEEGHSAPMPDYVFRGSGRETEPRDSVQSNFD